MGFARRKSVAAADADEARSRNRLSKPKPMSNSRTTLNERWTDAESQGPSTSQLSLEGHTKPLSRQQSRAQVKSHLFETTESVGPRPQAANRSKRGGVASLVMQFESAASTSQLSLASPTVPQKPVHEIYNSKQSSDTQQRLQVYSTSRDQLSERMQSTSTIGSPSASLDHLVDPFAIPRRRESSYRPGEATRKPILPQQEQQSLSRDEGPKAKSYYMQATADEAMLNRQAGAWDPLPPPPPPAGRTDTPTSLDVKSIGALRLGSLHIVNGHSSPVRSELSRQMISHQLRDVSSEYADSVHGKESVSDTWEDAELIDEIESNGPPTPTRSAFDVVDTFEPSTPDRGAGTPGPGTSSRLQTPTESPDKTSMMAQAYMNELQGSPFSYDGSSPTSTGSVVRHEKNGKSGDSPLSSRDSDCATAKRDFSFESKQESIDSGISSVPTARARDDLFASALEYQAPHFQPPASPERGISPEYQRPESVSKISDKADSGYHSGTSMLSLNVNDLLQGPASHLEQPDVGTSVESQKDVASKKSSSPKKLSGFLPLRPAFRRAPATEPVVPTILSVQTESPATMTSMATPTKLASSPKRAKKEREKEEKKEREREREERKEKEKEEKKAKTQKKLQKSRPLSRVRQSQEIVVQRLPSGESASDFPPVPDAVAANLKRRSLLVPELERTFRSQNDIKVEASTSNLALPMSDIRFPSPMPSEDVDESRSRSTKKSRDRSRSRPRSKSRRRSFLDYFRSEREPGNHHSHVSEEQTRLSIADFGDVVSSLGKTPYDIAHSRPHSPEPKSKSAAAPRANPHTITVNKHRPRSSMNDEEASEFARSRSHSLNERKDDSPRKWSFNDREGLPGKNLRTSIILDDAPPMPPLPTKEELRRISMRQSLPSSQPNTPSKAQNSSHEEVYDGHRRYECDIESSPAPLPPAHSPRPAFIDHQYDDEYQVEDQFELAPPPPSHSPAPMDIPAPPLPSHSPRPRGISSNQRQETVWEAQARAWKERRQSAGEALRHHRRSWNERDAQQDEHYEQAIEDEVGSEYPAIPPRHPGRNDWNHDPRQSWENDTNHYNSPHPGNWFHRAQTWNDESHDQHQGYEHQHSDHSQLYDHSPVRRHHTWDESQDFYSANGSAFFYQQQGNASRQSGHISRGSNDSRQSFYNHQNVPIDRPFDPPPRLSQDFEDDYGYPNEYYTPRTSPVRRQGPDRSSYDNRHYEHGEQYTYPHQSQRPNQHFYAHNDNYSAHSSPARPRSNRDSHSHQRQSRSPQPSPLRSHKNSLAPPSPSPSRPQSQQSRHSLVSLRSNGSAVSLADELHPEIEERPSAAPDFGRYSGGLGYGYEGRDRGFGGSAGTRTVSGKAEGGWKGTQLRGSFGIDLGDVPVIGLLKKVKA